MSIVHGALVLGFYDPVNSGNTDAFDDFVTEDFIEHEGFPTAVADTDRLLIGGVMYRMQGDFPLDTSNAGCP